MQVALNPPISDRRQPLPGKKRIALNRNIVRGEQVIANSKILNMSHRYSSTTTNRIVALVFTCFTFMLFGFEKNPSTDPLKERYADSLQKGLKDYFQNYFPIGVAVNPSSLRGADSTLILKEFNSLTAENDMKWSGLHPAENTWNWRNADAIVDFAVRNHLKVRGHNLLWHEYNPGWLFKDSTGNQVSKEILLKRLKDHITTVVKRYKGRVLTWDVVNEAVDDNPPSILRQNSMWYKICGEDFIARAFEYAHEADPNAILVYNDYNTERPEKRERIYKLLKKLVDAKVPIHAVGLQGHWSIFEPTKNELTEAIKKYSSLGLKIHFTEIDLSVYKWEKEPRAKTTADVDVLTPELAQKQTDQYKMVFNVFKQYKKVIGSVTFWNITDKTTWLDSYPVRGRKNYPLLFDGKGERKEAYWQVVKGL